MDGTITLIESGQFGQLEGFDDHPGTRSPQTFGMAVAKLSSNHTTEADIQYFLFFSIFSCWMK